MATENVHQVETDIVDAGTQLLDAIQARDTPQTLALLKQGAPIWFEEEETGWSALHFAAHYEDVELVDVLIERGAIWNASESRVSWSPRWIISTYPVLETPILI